MVVLTRAERSSVRAKSPIAWTLMLPPTSSTTAPSASSCRAAKPTASVTSLLTPSPMVSRIRPMRCPSRGWLPWEAAGCRHDATEAEGELWEVASAESWPEVHGGSRGTRQRHPCSQVLGRARRVVRLVSSSRGARIAVGAWFHWFRAHVARASL